MWERKPGKQILFQEKARARTELSMVVHTWNTGTWEAPGRLRQESGYKFKPSLSYLMNSISAGL